MAGIAAEQFQDPEKEVFAKAVADSVHSVA